MARCEALFEMNTVGDLLEKAEAVDDMREETSNWEADFLASVLPRLREGKAVSERQRETIERIYEKYRGKGFLT